MNIEDYLTKLNDDTQMVFQKTMELKSELGKAHHVSSCIFEFSQNINDTSEKEILNIVSAQLESATLNVTLGMYRQAFTSLRLALEMGLGAAHFSVHKLELHEWLDGRADIKWSSLIDNENGVLSKRFTEAFFKEFSADINEYNKKAKDIYRKLSEFVHGNNETWENCRIQISYNDDLVKSYFESIYLVADIILYVLSCRYLKSFSATQRESLEFIPEEMNHISYVREYFGGPKD